MSHTPNQEPRDVVAAFKAFVLKDGLKASKVEKYNRLSQCVEAAGQRVKEVLSAREASFAHVEVAKFAPAVVDVSLLGGNEFKLEPYPDGSPVKPNTVLAYVGDAYLTLYVAKEAFRHQHMPDTYQDTRTRATKKKNVARACDQLFDDRPPVVIWEGDMKVLDEWCPCSEKQRAEFVEALIGAMFEYGHPDLANWLCARVVEAASQ